MKKKLYYILMADIVDSRMQNQIDLISDFKKLVSTINTTQSDKIISPLTITLGDEFQGIIKDLPSAIKIIIALDEFILNAQLNFKLRYVLVQGKIDTPINDKIAYEMLGEGLTVARETLISGKKDKNHYQIAVKNMELSDALNSTFFVLQRIRDDWDPQKDYLIAARFIQNIDYKEIALEVNREKSLIWKRKKSLKIEEYTALKNVLLYLGNLSHE
jgi:hypothetical protein